MTTTVELVGPSAVVTGVSSGIGRAVAVALAQAGANVAGVHLGDSDGAEAVEGQIREAGREAFIVEADVGNPTTADMLAAEAIARWGSLDIWVNNAARLMVKPIIDTTDEDWHGLLATNLHGYFYGCRAAASAMYHQRRGRIINVSSAADIMTVANLTAYVTAKGGIVGLTKTLALEAAEHNVTVNAVAPGAITNSWSTADWSSTAPSATASTSRDRRRSPRRRSRPS
jgi:NAD(P)-dependent dehydrogenase (short-subunit alcohol dehydrogenase family)